MPWEALEMPGGNMAVRGSQYLGPLMCAMHGGRAVLRLKSPSMVATFHMLSGAPVAVTLVSFRREQSPGQ